MHEWMVILNSHVNKHDCTSGLFSFRLWMFFLSSFYVFTCMCLNGLFSFHFTDLRAFSEVLFLLSLKKVYPFISFLLLFEYIAARHRLVWWWFEKTTHQCLYWLESVKTSYGRLEKIRWCFLEDECVPLAFCSENTFFSASHENFWANN